jgi:hypothetical protein
MDKAKDAIAARAKREAAILLGVDIEHLSAADSLRVDMVSALRLVIDHEQGCVLSGGQADLGKLNVAVASLIALLPGRELPEPAPVDGGPNDPRTIMWENYKRQRDRGADVGQGYDGLVRKVKTLEAELASKDARIAELEAALAGSVPLPPNAVKLSTRNDNPSPSANRNHGSVSADAPPPAAASAPRTVDVNALPPAEPEPWRAFVNADGSIRSQPRGRWDV